MNIVSAKFIISVANGREILIDELPQVAFVGRSNVGKSSLLNFLVNQKKLAKTSSTPGRTRLINYFLVNNSFYFVDLPGYGFAKGSKEESNKWDFLMNPYFVNNPQLRCVCILLDCRRKPTELDKSMITYLTYHQIPFILIATKCDKLSKSKIKPAILDIANDLGVGKDNVFPSSTSYNLGKVEILEKLEQFINL